MRTGHPQRLATFDYRGIHRYFLTFCTFERRWHFVTDAAVEIVRTQFVRVAADEGFALSAYCFMPDHLHLLIEGQHDESDCRRFISRAKQLSGFCFQQELGTRLWQRYGYERVLRNDEATLSVARYIIENPVRAGLVTRVTEYRFTGSMLYDLEHILEAVQMSRSWRGKSG